MYKQYLKQALASLRENPLISTLMVMGTALSAAMLLVLLQLYEVRTASYAPVSSRDRMLFVTGIQADEVAPDSTGQLKPTGSRWMDGLGVPFVKETFQEMKTPQAVAIFKASTDRVRLTVPGEAKGREYDMKQTNAGFWNVFDFTFVDGQPYTRESFASGQRLAVLSREVAQKLFGDIEVAGRNFSIDYVEYTVCGVVEPVSEAVSEAYGQLFVPYTCDARLMSVVNADGICGQLNACLLAASPADFPAIREEVARGLKRYNANAHTWQANLFDQPHTAVEHMFKRWHETKLNALFFGMLCLAGLFFFLPVFNLLGLSFSQVGKRQEEIGLRKVFGATTSRVVKQMLCESLVVTLIGCVLGQALSVGFFLLAKDGLLERDDVQLTADMFFSPWLLLAALAICLLINFLAIGIPAWRVARRQIALALES